MNKFFTVLPLTACCLSVFGQIHDELKPYRDRFVSEAESRSITLPDTPGKMQFFTNGDTDIHGGCFWADNAVYINRAYWDAASEQQREQVVFHELAHYYFHAGHVRHIEADIMNPDAVFTDYAASRSRYLDALFRKIYETPVDRAGLTLRAGDIIITSDSPESETFRMHVFKGDARSLAVADSIMRTHRQYDYINAGGWRFRPFRYEGAEPVVAYDAKVSEAWGEMNRMYLFAGSEAKAPKLGNNARIRWNESTEMMLVVDYKTATVTVRNNATIMYFIRKQPSVREGREIINMP
jgi:hypothetical protein